MKYLSVCDGIGAAHVAWKPMGWQCVGASEIAPYPKAVVEHRHPEIPALGSMTDYHEWNIERPDLVCGGTPCQSFSVAGLRKGMADPRGNLALVFLGVVDHFRPRWVVWENVPGVLSSNQGRDFGAFLGGLGQLGYGFAYRVLDAQYFGLAQRRKRVFVVAHLGDWRSAAAVLFERESLRWHLAPSRGKGERAAPAITASASGGGGPRGDFHHGGGLAEVAAPLTTGHSRSGGGRYPGTNSDEAEESLITVSAPKWPADIAPTLNAAFGDKQGLEDQHALNGAGLFVPVFATDGQANAAFAQDQALALNATNEQPYIAAPMLIRMREGKEGGGKGPLISQDQSLTLATANDQVLAFTENSMREDGSVPTLVAGEKGGGKNAINMPHTVSGMQVRRLTPRECERLQGFPDDYTLVPLPLKPRQTRVRYTSDGARYKALGNSWAVPVVNWIGRRIEQVNEILSNQQPRT